MELKKIAIFDLCKYSGRNLFQGQKKVAISIHDMLHLESK